MRIKKILAILLSLSMFSSAYANTTTRIKDITNFEGVRENILIGYGLVVGLNGTGDKLNNNAFTEKSLQAYLERVGVNTKGSSLKTKNVAAVSVTAKLPAFARQGSKLDVTVSAMGDAKSLQGGVLLATPLMAADGEVYAVAQGPIAIGGFQASGSSGSSVTKSTPTNGFVSSGGIVEKEVNFDFAAMKDIKISLKNPDIATAMQIQDKINEKLQGKFAVAQDPGTVTILLPEKSKQSVTSFLADIEQLMVSTDQPARIIIDENSGTIVMGEDVRVDTVAIAQGNLTIRIDETPQVSQPGVLAPEGSQTTVVPRSSISVDEGSGNKMAVLEKGANLKDLVDGLNALGIGPRDMISILQNIKAAGALQAEIQVR